MTKLKPISTLISVLIISLVVGYVLAAWQEPSEVPPEGNIPAPINVGPAAQVKEGSPGTIAAGGFLGQVPSYGIYPDPGGASLIGSSLTITGSTSYLRLPLLTTTQRDALSPQTGMMIYNTTLNETQIYVPSGWKKLAYGSIVGISCTVPADCLSGFCADGYCCDRACTGGGLCQTCGTYSSAGVGYCGYVNSSAQDPRNECGTTGCYTDSCNGSGYACGYYTSGEHNCTTACKTCTGASSGSCVDIPNNTQDAEDSYLCNQTCKKCSSGSCVNQSSGQNLFGHCTAPCPCRGDGSCSVYQENSYSWPQVGGVYLAPWAVAKAAFCSPTCKPTMVVGGVKSSNDGGSGGDNCTSVASNCTCAAKGSSQSVVSIICWGCY